MFCAGARALAATPPSTSRESPRPKAGEDATRKRTAHSVWCRRRRLLAENTPRRMTRQKSRSMERRQKSRSAPTARQIGDRRVRAPKILRIRSHRSGGHWPIVVIRATAEFSARKREARDLSKNASATLSKSARNQWQNFIKQTLSTQKIDGRKQAFFLDFTRTCNCANCERASPSSGICFYRRFATAERLALVPPQTANHRRARARADAKQKESPRASSVGGAVEKGARARAEWTIAVERRLHPVEQSESRAHFGVRVDTFEHRNVCCGVDDQQAAKCARLSPTIGDDIEANVVYNRRKDRWRKDKKSARARRQRFFSAQLHDRRHEQPQKVSVGARDCCRCSSGRRRLHGKSKQQKKTRIVS